MLQIKTLKFCLWNNTVAVPTAVDYYNSRGLVLVPIDKIDKEVNKVLDKLALEAEIKDIRINDCTVQRHNNGGLDTILRTYTILYTK